MELWERVRDAYEEGDGATLSDDWQAATTVAVAAERERCLWCLDQAAKENGGINAPLNRACSLIHSGLDPAAKEPGQVLAEAVPLDWSKLSSGSKGSLAKQEAAVRAHYCPKET